MVEKVSFIQKRLKQLIRVIIPPHPIDIGRFTAIVMEKAILESRDELGIDFDKVNVYPGAQPKESSDIEFIKNGEIIARINLKTAVSGDIKVALRRLAKSIRGKEIGAVAFFALFYKNDKDKKVDTKMVIALIPGDVFDYYEISDIHEVILTKVDEKIHREGYTKMEILAINEAIELLRTYEVIITREAVEKLEERFKKLEKTVKELKEENKTTKATVSKLEKTLMDEIGDLRRTIGGLKGEVEALKGEVGDLRGTVVGLKGEVEALKKESKEMNKSIKEIQDILREILKRL